MSGSENEGGLAWTLVREALLAGGMISLLILGLWAHTGSMPPLVVVESDSMVHVTKGEVGSIDAGDLILVHNVGAESVVTYAEASQPSNPKYGYESHGLAGDVIIFHKNGNDGTPIIHRAILKTVANSTTSPIDRAEKSCPSGASWDAISLDSDGEKGTCVLTWDVPGTSLVNVDNISWQFDGEGTGLYDCKRNSEFNHGGIVSDYLSVENWDPNQAGFLTLGDNNHCSVDQGSSAAPGSSGLATTDENGRFKYGIDAVRSDWLVGKAGGEIPWLGTVKLMISGNEPGTAYVPSSSWVGLVVSVAVVLAIPFILEPLFNGIMARSPEVEEDEREQTITLVAKNLFEEE